MPPAPTTPTTPRRTRAYTTTAGERVTKFSDGTETRVPKTPTVQGVATQAPATPPSPNVPVGAIENNAPAPVQIPEVTPPQVDTAGVKTAGQAIIDAELKRTQDALAQAQAPVTESERKIREAFGLLQGEEQTRQQLEETQGVNQFSEDLRTFQESLRRQVAELDQFDLDNVNTIESMRVNASRNDLTKRTFGAQSAEAGIQMAVQRAGMVASTRATIAAVDVTQGNLEAATEQVQKALDAVYNPIRMGLQMEQFFLQRNDKRFDAAQQEAAAARNLAITRQFAEIDRATNLVDAAVSSGYASGEDIKQMTALSGDPQAQAEYARKIVATGNRMRVNMEIQAHNARMAEISAAREERLKKAADEAEAARIAKEDGAKLSTEKNQELLRNLNIIKDNRSVVARMTTGGWLRGVSTFLGGTAAGTGLGAAAGSVVPVLGTGAGAVAGTIGGAIGTYTNMNKNTQDVLIAANFLLNNSSFQAVRDEKQSGVTFGPLTNEERRAAGAAANAFVNSLVIDESGNVIDIRGDIDTVMRNAEIVAEKIQLNQDRTNRGLLSPEIDAAISAAYNE